MENKGRGICGGGESLARSEEMSGSLHNEKLPGTVAWLWAPAAQRPGSSYPDRVLSLGQLEAAAA